MALAELLLEREATILQRWFDLIADTYPPDTARFLRQEKDPFLNPVGSSIAREIKVIFAELQRGGSTDKLASALDGIAQIRAVQEFTPGRALAFIFLLKRAVRDDLASHLRDGSLWGELLAYESRIDEAALVAFDIYMRRREKIHEIRTNEIRQRSELLLERLSRIYGGPEREPPDVDRPDSTPSN